MVTGATSKPAAVQHREMASERIAPGMLPRVLNSFDMTIIFVAIVLFIVNASALQPAGQAAFTFWIFQAGVTVIWCLSMVLLFADIFLVKRAFPKLFSEVRAAHPYLLYASGAVGMLASAFGAYVTFRSPWTPLFSSSDWRLWLSMLCGVSALTAVVIYVLSELVHRRERQAVPA